MKTDAPRPFQVVSQPLSPREPASVLLVVNQGAATGHGDERTKRLEQILISAFGLKAKCVAVDGHEAVSKAVDAFLETAAEPALVIVGGGGGTLRATIEAICSSYAGQPLPDGSRVRLAALRMGSGNVFAKQLGVPADPAEGLRALTVSALSGATTRACIMRFTTGPGEHSQVYHGATLCGLGQFGRIPGDLARWHERFPGVQRAISRFLGIENLTTIEYATVMVLRSLACALRPKLAEEVHVVSAGRAETLRLLAGTVQNFPLPSLPFDPGVTLQDAAIALHALPFAGRLWMLAFWFAPKRFARRAQRIVVRSGEHVELRLADRASSEFFVDEDPLVFTERIRVEVAGTLAFVPVTEDL